VNTITENLLKGISVPTMALPPTYRMS